MKERKAIRFFLNIFVIPSIPSITLMMLKPTIIGQYGNSFFEFLVLFAAAFILFLCSAFMSATVTKMTGGKVSIQWSKKGVFALFMAAFYAIGLSIILTNALTGQYPLVEVINGRSKIDSLVLWTTIFVWLGLNLLAAALTEATFKK